MNTKDRKNRLRLRFSLLAMVALFSFQTMALRTGHTAEYPTKPISIIVPFSPGAGADLTGRIVAEYLRKKWGQPVSVLNVAGGGGILGTQRAMESKPDGYTILVDVHSTAAMIPAVYENLPFDWTKRTPIARVFRSYPFFLVRPDLPVKTLGDLAKELKENPKKFSWGTSSPAGSSTFVLAQFFDILGINFSSTNMVVFGDGIKTINALAGGHVDIITGAIDDSYAILSSGKARPIAIIGDKRSPEFPQAPTVAEAGYPNLDVTFWQSLSGPAGLPQSIVEKWATALQEATNDQEFITLSQNAKKNIAYLGPQDCKAFIEKEYKNYQHLAKKMNLVIQYK